MPETKEIEDERNMGGAMERDFVTNRVCSTSESTASKNGEVHKVKEPDERGKQRPITTLVTQ